MKETLLKFLVITLILSLTSCDITKRYYQVYQAESTDENIKTDSDELVYEDENCIVTYDLWSENGDMGFKFYNKTDKNIYLNLTESFYVFNGLAHDYYLNKIYSSINSTEATTKNDNSVKSSILNTSNQNTEDDSSNSEPKNQNSLSYQQNKVVIIPSKTAKIISEYDVFSKLYRDCDIEKYPSKKETSSVSFSQNNTPFTFSNRIAYKIGKNESLNRFENEFYISKITNYPEKEIVKEEKEEFCGEEGFDKVKTIKNASADKFYIIYNKTDNFKH